MNTSAIEVLRVDARRMSHSRLEVIAWDDQPQRARHGLDPVALAGGQLLAVALRRRQRRAAHRELEPRAADRRSVAEPERLEVVDAERAAPQAADQLGAEVAPAGDRDELEAAVVGLGARVEDPLASEDLGVLHDDVEHVLEVMDGAVDHGVDVELDVDDVALDEALEHRAGVHELIAVQRTEPGDPA